MANVASEMIRMYPRFRAPETITAAEQAALLRATAAHPAPRDHVLLHPPSRSYLAGKSPGAATSHISRSLGRASAGARGWGRAKEAAHSGATVFICS
jgi:hypothetical protein